MSRRVDLTGKTFGELEVMDFVGIRKYSEGKSCAVWEVRCSCGHTYDVPSGNLVSGNTKRCNDCRLKDLVKLPKNISGLPSVQNRLDLTGNVYGDIVVLGFAHYHKTPSGYRKRYWNVKCSCGAKYTAETQSLNEGKTKRCNVCRVKALSNRGNNKNA